MYKIYTYKQTYKQSKCLSLKKLSIKQEIHIHRKRINQSYWFKINASILCFFFFYSSIYRKGDSSYIDSSATAFALSFSLPAPARRTYTHMRLFFSFFLLRQGRQQKHTRGTYTHTHKHSDHIGIEREKEGNRVGGQLYFALVTPIRCTSYILD